MSARPRIVIDARESGTSTGRYIDKLIEYLHKLEPSYDFIILAKPHRLEYLRSVAPGFKVIKSEYREFGFGEQLGLLAQITRLRPDLVHFGMTHQPVLYKGKTVTTVHDLTTVRFDNPAKNQAVFRVKQKVYERVIRRVARKSAHILVPSKFVKADLAGYARISPRKITVTYEAADKIAEPAEAVKGLKKGAFIMYVGRPLPHKNLIRLVEAFAIIHQSRPELKLVLAGGKHTLYDQVEFWAKQNKIRGLVFPGFVSEGQLRWLYENTKAYVFPSLSEGFGLPGLEAMVHGAPVLSSNATCLPEIYGDAAGYFEPTNVQQMASKIAQVVDHPKQAEKLREKGFKQAEKYSWARTAEQTLEVYKKVLKNHDT